MSSFNSLKKYIVEDMSMQHIYQPVMLIELLKNQGNATEEAIARVILNRDPTQVDYYIDKVRNMVGKVLRDNGITERDNKSAISFNGEVVHKLLITHMHSYATPIIRYDIGDYATFKMTCPCGHDGITLSNIYGRSKFFIKKLNGELIPFRIFSKPLSDIISFKEFFISQPDLNTIAIEISGALILSDEEKTNITKFIHELSDNSFNVQIKLVKNIDWSKNPKRLPFISYV